MKVTVNKIDALKRELKFEIPRERVSKKMEDVYTEIGKVAKVRGFRPGKAPRHILEVEHGTLAKEETLKKLIPEVYQEGLVQEKIDPLDMPEIHDVSFKDGTISFTAHLEVQPEITVKKYKGITVKRKSNQVTDEEIHKTLAYFKTSQGEGKETAIDDNFAKGLGYPGLEIFKQSLVRQMEIDKDRQNRADVENQIIDAVLHESRFVVPQSMVNKLLEKRL